MVTRMVMAVVVVMSVVSVIVMMIIMVLSQDEAGFGKNGGDMQR